MGATYKTPMLIAKSALIFSFLLIAARQTIVHGNILRITSIEPEYAVESTY